MQLILRQDAKMKRDIAVLTFLCKYRYAFGFFVNIFKQPRTFGSGHFFVLDTLYYTAEQFESIK